MNLVIVSPHRDDAAFSLGLTIRHWLASGHRIVVLNCFTRSNYAPFAELDTVHENDQQSFVTALRLREDQAWLRSNPGALQLHDLNMKDAPIRFALPAEAVCQELPREQDKAFGKIRRALALLKADAIVLPLGLGGHVDHLTARDAALLSSDSPAACAFYEDLPYATRLIPDDSIEAAASQLGLHLDPCAVGAEAALPLEAVRVKRKISLFYDSQIDDNTATEIAETCLRYGGRERLWVTPRWQALMNDCVNVR